MSAYKNVEKDNLLCRNRQNYEVSLTCPVLHIYGKIQDVGISISQGGGRFTTKTLCTFLSNGALSIILEEQVAEYCEF